MSIRQLSDMKPAERRSYLTLERWLTGSLEGQRLVHAGLHQWLESEGQARACTEDCTNGFPLVFEDT